MSRSRKIFASQVVLPPNAATSLLSLMSNSPLKWGFESDGTTPSLDSILGSNAGIVPSSSVVVGSDANVNNTTGGSNYRGVFVATGANYSLQDFGAADGIIDPNQIYFYSSTGCNMDVSFTAR